MGPNNLDVIVHILESKNAELADLRAKLAAAEKRAEAAEAERDALRAALGKIAGPPIEPDLDGLIEDATCTYCEQPSLEGCTEDCPRSIAVDALALTPPAAVKEEDSNGIQE